MIYGGETENMNLMNDFYVLNQRPKQTTAGQIFYNWNKPKGKRFNELPYLAGHAGCCVISKRQKLVNLEEIVDSSYEEVIHDKVTLPSKYDYTGLYVFGGKNMLGDAIAMFFVIELGVKPLRWTHLEPNGYPPEPRFQHTMNFIPDCKFFC